MSHICRSAGHIFFILEGVLTILCMQAGSRSALYLVEMHIRFNELCIIVKKVWESMCILHCLLWLV